MNAFFKKNLEIEKYLRDLDFTNEDISIYTGISGVPLYYYYLYKLTNEAQYLNKIHESLEVLYLRLNEDEYDFSFSNGLAGIAYLINYLVKCDIINKEDVEESLNYFDQILMNNTIASIKGMEDLDLLHGGLGIAYYLLERSNKNPEVKEKIETLFEKISVILIDDLNLYCNRKLNDSKRTINCGLAHGLVSFIVVFSKFLEDFPDNEVILEGLKKSIKVLLTFESSTNLSHSIFPGIANNPESASYNIHLGWCYGDQTIALGLYRAGMQLGDMELIDKSKKIAFRTLERNTIKKALKSESADAGFCHGTSSVAYFHKKWYEITNDIRFYKAYKYFINETLKKGDRNKGIAGYQKYEGNNIYSNKLGLLDGSIGIGIVLMDFLSEEKQDWESFFFLS